MRDDSACQMHPSRRGRPSPGGLIVVDNVVRDAELVNPASDDLGMRRLVDQVTVETRVSATGIGRAFRYRTVSVPFIPSK